VNSFSLPPPPAHYFDAFDRFDASYQDRVRMPDRAADEIQLILCDI